MSILHRRHTGTWKIVGCAMRKVEKLLDACDEWNLSISVAKGLEAEGLETHLKDLSALQELPFPTNLRSIQSFLGSTNYYSRFIEDFAIYASVLYELREADFFEIARMTKLTGGDEDVIAEEGNMWSEARTAFAILKNKIVTAPILQHFDVDRQPVVVVYASKWEISAALMQGRDGIYKPVTFTSHPNEIKYGMVDKEVLAQLRILNISYTQLMTRSIKTLEIVKCSKAEDEILSVIAASIKPRKEADAILVLIDPMKQPRQVISMSPPTVEPDERLEVVSLEGSTRVKRNGGAYRGIVWILPGWVVISAPSTYETRFADSLASAALHREDGVAIATEEERLDHMTLNRLDELLIAKNDATIVKITSVTRSLGSDNLADFADPAIPQWSACPDLLATRDFIVSPKKMF
ncbi:reverse transcriptase [Phytophthora palmivora]|uniref:Reverse transcriptase n=1 Tax=Phytophthora palmivora TaxID=4796 RepID=A0A2P4XAG6_9STRA|nr:reverse transcriptase [Phytophthora palmivora]